MMPVECVVRNVCAGSMAKRYGIDEGTRLPEPIFEFFLKSDALHDPLVNDDHIRVLRLGDRRRDRADEGADASRQRRAEADVRRRGHRPRRLQARVRPSARRSATARSCWATNSRRTAAGCGTRRTGEKIDKDRFRRDLGNVIEHYRDVGTRIGVPL